MKRKQVPKSEDFALLVSLILNPLEISSLFGGIISNISLLLLVNLSDVYDLLYRPGRNQPIDLDSSELTDSVSSILSLQIVARIPIRIKDHDFVGTCDVQTDAWRHVNI